MEARKPVVVLIVEDEPFIRMDVADYLAGPDIVALEASNADEAWRLLLERGDVDILFTDVNMPGTMDGLQLAARVRERSPGIGIMIASGMVRVARSSLPEETEFLEKPYDLGDVMKFVKRHAGIA